MNGPYVFDTSSLVGAWVRTYPPDSFPRVWENLEVLAASGQLLAPEEVLEELKRQDDELLAWVKDRSGQIIVPTSRAVMLEAKAVLIDHSGLTKVGTGRGLADPFVIALASLKTCPVVTQEQGGSLSKPRIPFVCAAQEYPVHELPRGDSVRRLALLDAGRPAGAAARDLQLLPAGGWEPRAATTSPGT